jgi:WD40 repeat protein
VSIRAAGFKKLHDPYHLQLVGRYIKKDKHLSRKILRAKKEKVYSQVLLRARLIAENATSSAVTPIASSVPTTKVTVATLSRNDGRLAVGYRNGAVVVTEINGNNVVSSQLQHKAEVVAIQIARNKNRIVSVDKSGLAVSYDIGERGKIAKCMLPLAQIGVAAVSPNSGIIAVAGKAKGGEISIFRPRRASSGRCAVLRRWRLGNRHPNGVTYLKFSSCGRLLLSAGRSKEVYIWSLKTGTVVASLLAHGGIVRIAEFNTDRHLVATGTWNGIVGLYELSSGKLVHSINLRKGAITALQFMKANQYLVGDSILGYYFKIGVQDGQHSIKQNPTSLNMETLSSAVIGKSALKVRKTRNDGSIVFADLSKDKRYSEIDVGGTEVTSLDISVSKKQLLIGTDGGHGVISWSFSRQCAPKGIPIDLRYLPQPIRIGGPIRSFFTRNGGMIVSFGASGFVVWSNDQGKLIAQKYTSQIRGIPASAYIGKRNWLVYVTENKYIHAVSLEKERRKQLERDDRLDSVSEPSPRADSIRGFSITAARVTDIDIRSDDEQMIGAAIDGAVKVWSLRTGALTNQLRAHRSRVTAVKYAPGSKYFVTGDANGTLRIWQTAHLTLRKTIKGSNHAIRSIAFSNNSKLLISGDTNGKIRLWRFPSGRYIRTINAGDGNINALAWHSGGGYLISGSSSGAVKIWDPMKPELMLTLYHSRDEGWVAFTPDGYVDGNEDGKKYLRWKAGERSFSHHLAWSGRHVPDLVCRVLNKKDAFRLDSLKRLTRHMLTALRKR